MVTSKGSSINLSLLFSQSNSSIRYVSYNNAPFSSSSADSSPNHMPSPDSSPLFVLLLCVFEVSNTPFSSVTITWYSPVVFEVILKGTSERVFPSSPSFSILKSPRQGSSFTIFVFVANSASFFSPIRTC